MANLTPYIFSDNAREQAEYYIDVLGGEIQTIQTFGDIPGASEAYKDKVVHLSLVAAGARLFMTDSDSAPVKHGNGIHLALEFATEAEARTAFERLAEDGNVKVPLEPAFWGTLFGQVEDKYGVSWMITNEPRSSV